MSPFIMGQTTQDLPSQAKTLSFAKFSSLVLIGPIVNKIIISILKLENLIQDVWIVGNNAGFNSW